jgi:hypothetical protein
VDEGGGTPQVEIFDYFAPVPLQEALNEFMEREDVRFPYIVAFEVLRDSSGYSGVDRYIAIVQYESSNGVN